MRNEQEVISSILDSFPRGKSSALIVHASFSGLSQQGLKAENFCEKLIQSVEGGTILMPTMTWRTVTLENPIFDEMDTASHTGVLSEVFRQQFSTHRSLHPTHSVAGFGPLAEMLLGSHHQGTTPCAGNSPYGLIREYDAYVLLLGGVGLEVCTAIHHCEEVMDEGLYVLPKEKSETYQLRSRHGQVIEVKMRRHPRLNRNFNKFGPYLEKNGGLVRGEALSVPWVLVSLNSLYRHIFAELAKDTKATLSV